MSLFPGPQTPAPPAGRHRHPFFMHDMIRREPEAVAATLRSAREAGPSLPGLPLTAPLYLVGQGTSFHAALAAAPAAVAWLGSGRRVAAIASFDVVLAEAELDPSALAVVFSASGDTAVTLRAQEALTRRHVPNVLVTHTPSSPSAERATHVIATRHAEEASWAHTVSYAAAVTAAWGLFEHWAGAPAPVRDALDRATSLVSGIVDREAEIRAAAEPFRDRSKLLLLGSGPAEATVREAALKLREASGRFTAVVGVEEALHGPMPAVDESTAVIALALGPIDRDRAETALRAASLAGARTLLVAPGGPAPGVPTVSIPELPPALSAVVDIVPFQWLAYWLGVDAGRNPDIMGLEIPRILAARSSFGI